MKWIIILFLNIFLVQSMIAQDTPSLSTDQQLAQYYFNQGDFIKAQDYYSKLYIKDPNKINFYRLLTCYAKNNNEKESEKLIKKQISLFPNDIEYSIELADFYEQHNELEKANKIYKNLIESSKENPALVINLYQSFKSKAKYDLALEILEKGRKNFKDSYPLNFQFAELYGLTNKTDEMFKEYINLLELNPEYLEQIENTLTKLIDFSTENETSSLFKTKLLEKIQKNPEDETFSQLLIWYFIQRKNFKLALNQSIAFDKRTKGKGAIVYDLGRICIENKAYTEGREAFKYIINQGPTNNYFYEAEGALLNSRFIEVTTNRNYSTSEIEATIQEYKTALNTNNRKKYGIPMVIELAVIEAFYGNQADSAITQLNEILAIPNLTDMQRAEIKMKLADILVLKGEIWDASIYYMQVDKDFKFEPIGHEAKFKNARIFYYDGEFDFAQSQLSILKESTSKLIANDAMDLSLLITENYGLDSNYEAMEWFAKGDLLIEQHLYQEAFLYFDSITTKYAYHTLSDEILLRKAKAMQLQGKWNEAIVYLNELLKYYSEDILADDALFQLGDIYENQLLDKEKAAECYKKILFDYKGSLHVIEARKRYRILRGDKVEADLE